MRWTSAERWDGILVERIHLERFEPPEFESPDHCVVVPLTPAPVEFLEHGRFRRHALVPGYVSVFPSGAPRRVRHAGQEVLVVALSRAVFTRVAERAGAAPAEQHCVRDPVVDHVARALAAEAESGFGAGRLYGESLGLALAAHLLGVRAAPAPAPRTGGIAPHRLKQLTAYIESHLSEDVSVAALAEVVGLSPHRFAHNFKRATGVPPHRWLIRARIDRARRMLRESDVAIGTVACATGFGSASRFAVLFRRATGITPSAYRASFR